MRIRNNELYRKYLADVPGIRFQNVLPQAESVSWMNTIVLDPAIYGHTKDELIAYLRENNVDSRLLFNGMHRQESLANFGCDCSGEYPICDMLTENGFYLPSASSLSEDTIVEICKLIANYQK
jgi:perosamine synthetase